MQSQALGLLLGRFPLGDVQADADHPHGPPNERRAVFISGACGDVSSPAVDAGRGGTLTVQVPDNGAGLNAETVTAYALATAKNRFGITLSAVKAVIVQYGLRTAGVAGNAAQVAGL